MIDEAKNQIVTLMTIAFAFVAALVWKDAIVAWFRPLTSSMSGSIGLTIVAVIVTIVVVFMTMLVTKAFGEKKE